MCGIVGAVAQRNVTPILLEGLKRLEYRGYDLGVLAHEGGAKTPASEKAPWKRLTAVTTAARKS